MRSLSVLLAFVLASPALAQAPALQFTGRVDVGAVQFGRFLEQRVNDSERELKAASAVQFGASVGVGVSESASVEVGVHLAPTDLRFRDDSGTGSEALDVNDVADLSLTTVSAIVRTGLPSVQLGAFRPYGLAGAAVGVWSVEGNAIDAADDTQVRFGAVTGAGIAAGAGRVGGFVEVIATGLGNPFDGADAFRLDDDAGETFDEPSAVPVLSGRIGLTARL